MHTPGSSVPENMKAVDSFSGVILSGINYNLMMIMMMMMMMMMMKIMMMIMMMMMMKMIKMMMMMMTIMLFIIITMMIFDNKGLQTDARHDRQMNKHKCN